MTWTKEKQLAYMKKYYAENKEQILETNQRWRDKNRELHLKRSMEYHWKNRNAILLKKREYAKRTKDRRAHLLRLKKFGLTQEAYTIMVKAQNGCCAVCGRKEKLVVDHDHETNRVRALLCSPCNTALGLFDENLGRLQAAVYYLNRQRWSTIAA